MPDSHDDVPLLGQGLTWEDMTAGSSFRTAARTITESDLMSFVHLAGFNEPLFYDASHAAAGGYTGRLVPGALVYVLAEGLILQTNVLHGTGLAFMHMDYSVKTPTYVGDTLHVVVTTTESRASSQAGAGGGHVALRRVQPARNRGRCFHACPPDQGAGFQGDRRAP